MREVLDLDDILTLRGLPYFLFDLDYLRALQNRDPETENHLIASFSKAIQVKLQMRLRSPELVQDARQETFLRILTYFRSGKTLENPASLPGFVHSVCHNVALEFLRSHTRHDQLAENAPEPLDASAGPEEQVVTEERKQIVRKLLGELPAKDRELLRRVLLEEEDKDAVSREFGVGRNYLRVLLHRARLRFKAALLDSREMRAKGESR
ncbi:MAG TPA: sigma-70 family RNA polymerase sigma factor [Bryobacteraceae bacterium]|nr:sigma-70 family RNA polymerase sigma factor [Bryobacteraceae bacterium]